MNRSGFTTVEVIIASALIVALITGGAVGMKQVTLLNQVAATRTSHTEMRTQVLAALSDSGDCAKNLGNPILPNPGVLPSTSDLGLTVNSVSDHLGAPVIENNKPAPGLAADGLIYKLALFRSRIVEPMPVAPGRMIPTFRYPVQLEIRGERKTLKEMGGMQADVVGRIPLSAEFEQGTGKLVSCTIHPDDMDEGMLAGNRHSVRDCLKVDGMPIPTAMGLICRVPYRTPNSKNNRGNTIPPCGTLTAGYVGTPWINAAGPINYNTTAPVRIRGAGCKGPVTGTTGWHAMSRTMPESYDLRVKRGTTNALNDALAGIDASQLIILGGLTILFGVGILVIAFILSLFKRCKKSTFTFYAQVNGVGCI